jgi:putative ABC transport system permease protein
MKLLPLVWAGLWRRPARSVLTALCILIAFVLLGLLQGVNAGFERAIANAHRDLLTTRTRVRGGAPMPVSAKGQIARVSGVLEVTQRAYFTGYFGEQTASNLMAALATEPDLFFRLRPAFNISQKNLDAMRLHRNGMVCTPLMLQYYHWRVGDTVTLHSPIVKADGTADWSFLIVGAFDTKIRPGTAYLTIINYAYLDESRAQDRGTAEIFYERIADPEKSVATAAAIDRIFANSSHESLTQSDQERAQFQAKQMGDVKFFTDAITAAVLFTLAFLTGNTLRQSLYERTHEFAVLKACGYSNIRVLLLACAEALLLYIPPALLGLAVAWLIAPHVREYFGSAVTPPVVASSVAMTGLICAALLALVGAALPSLRLARLPIPAALGRR